MGIRGFEKISKYANVNFPMPVRKTKFSAGYDFCVPEDVTLEPGVMKLVPTGIKAYMQEGEFLGMHIRSSMAVKKQVRLVNNVGIIDADYYNNPDNEGHIMFAVSNDFIIFDEPIMRIAQGVFLPYLVADNDNASDERTGGIGSTGK